MIFCKYACLGFCEPHEVIHTCNQASPQQLVYKFTAADTANSLIHCTVVQLYSSNLNANVTSAVCLLLPQFGPRLKVMFFDVALGALPPTNLRRGRARP